MKTIRLLLVLLLSVIGLGSIEANNLNLSNETIKYKVVYKWGLVHKQAGTARIVLSRSAGNYVSTAYAKSDPWADKIYHLRDTLRTIMRTSDFSPIKYEYTAHEDGKYSHDVVTFTHSGNTVTGKCIRIRKKKGEKTATTKNTTLSATGMTVDMLSSFYYIRTLDYPNMKSGTKKVINIFSGKKKELLTLTYSGTENITYDGKTYKTYKVTFTFTSDGKKQTSEPIQAWVSTDAKRIPIKLIGKLKIGQVQCLYVP